MICGIANEFGQKIPMDGQPPYDPKVYEFVFGKIIKNRHFTPLPIEEIFKVSVINEQELHNIGSLAADSKTANRFAREIMKEYPTDETIDAIVKDWYLN